MVRIRMKRLGRTHRPFYRISVMDIRKARDGESIEDIGTYDPMVHDKSKRVTVKLDRYDYWLSVGAQPSDNVKTLVKKLKGNRWGVAAPPPAYIAPKEPVVAAVEEAPAEGGEAAAE